ncbi:MAG: hypothetical protein IPJ94_05240 [Chloroflexi bacterium]|nr:hypothetical protein [Chloroflexota bacterium]
MNGEWGEERPFLSVNFSSPAAPCNTHNALIPTGMTIAVAGTTIAVAGMSIAVAGMTIAVAGMSIAVVGMSIAVVGMSIAVAGMSIAVAGMSIAVAGMSIAVVETAVPHTFLTEKDTIALWGKGKRPCCVHFYLFVVRQRPCPRPPLAGYAIICLHEDR